MGFLMPISLEELNKQLNEEIENAEINCAKQKTRELRLLEDQAQEKAELQAQLIENEELRVRFNQDLADYYQVHNATEKLIYSEKPFNELVLDKNIAELLKSPQKLFAFIWKLMQAPLIESVKKHLTETTFDIDGTDYKASDAAIAEISDDIAATEVTSEGVLKAASDTEETIRAREIRTTELREAATLRKAQTVTPSSALTFEEEIAIRQQILSEYITETSAKRLALDFYNQNPYIIEYQEQRILRALRMQLLSKLDTLNQEIFNQHFIPLMPLIEGKHFGYGHMRFFQQTQEESLSTLPLSAPRFA